jgi:small subunit ribosomal protein S16
MGCVRRSIELISEQVGILEPQYRISKIQGQVVKADSAAKSLIPETPVTPPAEAEVTQEQKVEA